MHCIGTEEPEAVLDVVNGDLDLGRALFGD